MNKKIPPSAATLDGNEAENYLFAKIVYSLQDEKARRNL